MYSLNETQLSVIREEVNRQKLTYSHLADDLIDHLACEIELMIWNGSSFEKAFHHVFSMIGQDGLIKIQNDTLYLIDKNYRIMKNLVKWIGMVSMMLIALGTLFKVLHFPGANPSFLAGFFLLIIFYFPSAVYVMKKETQEIKGPWIYGSAIAGGILIMAGILFKVLHWPYALFVMTLGYIFINGFFIPTLLYFLMKNTADRFLRNVYLTGAIAVFTVVIGLICKINHYPGAFVLLILGSFGLTAGFLPLYSFSKYRNETRINVDFVLLSTGVLYFIMFSMLLAIR